MRTGRNSYAVSECCPNAYWSCAVSECCPSTSWKYCDGHCYYDLPATSYNSAARDCQNYYNADLAAPRTPQEQACIEESGVTEGRQIWIGVKQVGDSNNPFVYETDGAPVTYDKWDDGYPKYLSTDMNCVYLEPAQPGNATSEQFWRDDKPCGQSSESIRALCQFG